MHTCVYVDVCMFVCVCKHMCFKLPRRFFFFLRCWGLNSGPSTWASLLALFCDGSFWDRVSQTICPGWVRTTILLISASCVARNIGMSHWCLAVPWEIPRHGGEDEDHPPRSKVWWMDIVISEYSTFFGAPTPGPNRPGWWFRKTLSYLKNSVNISM
jgi:hypothetical protein